MGNLRTKDAAGTTVYLKATGTGTDIDPYILTQSAQLAGDVASGAADSGSPVKIGGKAESSQPTAVDDGDRVDALLDLVGRVVTFPYALPQDLVSGSTASITDTTPTSVVAAAGAGVRNYATTIAVQNAHATVSTWVKITDGSGGTVLWRVYAPAAGGGAVVTLPSPLRGSANTALFAECETSGADVRVNIAGFKSSI